jgi:hypothetical protein
LVRQRERVRGEGARRGGWGWGLGLGREGHGWCTEGVQRGVGAHRAFADGVRGLLCRVRCHREWCA